MKLIFMGTPEIAASVLKSVIDSGKHEIEAVVTRTDKPKGRGHEMDAPPVKKLALENGLVVLQPEKASAPEFIEKIREYAPDVIVVAAYGKILKPALLEIPKYGCINVHASLLPKYRGAAPIQQAVIDGEEKSGITIMHMAEGLDTGDMIIKKEIPLEKKETAGSLHDKMAEAGGPLLLEALDLLEAGTAPRIVQNEAEATYVTTIDKSMGKIDFNNSAVKIERLIRGLNPWPTAFTYLNGKLLKIWDADVCALEGLSKEFKNAECGTVVDVTEDHFTVLCDGSLLKINSLQIEGKKRMDTADFLRGFKVEKGTLLGN
ncbi:MAG: methionyl-tRNA formyltransferase [Lachnospiraceae bacterium]|nr:methionyl-tRNA formyltransferase [Lachnospiraceae bacterium]